MFVITYAYMIKCSVSNVHLADNFALLTAKLNLGVVLLLLK